MNEIFSVDDNQPVTEVEDSSNRQQGGKFTQTYEPPD